MKKFWVYFEILRPINVIIGMCSIFVGAFLSGTIRPLVPVILAALAGGMIAGAGNAINDFFDVEIKDILGKSRKKELVYPRQISMFLIREEIGSSFPTIGNELGGRDHTTAMHAHNKIKKEHKENGKIKQDIESIKQLLYREC